MKRFVVKVLLFSAFVAVMDIAFCFIFSALRSHAKGGSTENCEYIANRSTDDIIILGSSRATHHYVSQIIEDSLGMSCYNCGEEGNGVVLAYGRLKMLTGRYRPKLVLYEITPCYDYGTVEPNNKYLGYLRSYYYKDEIQEIFADFDDELSWLKMKSSMYQNNSRLLPDLVDNVIVRDNNKGYSPLYGRLSRNGKKNNVQPLEVDSLKLSYIQKIIDCCRSKDISLVFMMSPEYDYGEDMVEYIPVLNICKQNDVPVLNYINDTRIVCDISLFQDLNHLNNEGAVFYTQLIIPKIRKYIPADES